MLRLNRIILSLAALFATVCGAGAANPNIVIQQLDYTYKFIPAKGGERLEKVEITENCTFRANRKEDTAQEVSYYDDSTLKLNKITGGDVSYGLMFNDDIFFDDSKAALVNVDLKKAGATAKTSISKTYIKPEFFNKVFISEPYAVELASYTFELPASMESRFTFEPRNIDPAKIVESTERKGNKIIKRFTLKDLPEPKHFGDAPSRNICAPQIVVRGHFRDVDELYKYLLTYIDPTDPGASAVEAKAREITAGCSTDAERIDAITRWVHDNIRYVAVEHGEFSHKPDQPSEVLRKLYGDCKCSASLLAAMFRAVGLDGRRVWIGTTSIADNWTDNPSISSGNHMIACVMLPADSIVFVDGTATYSNPPLLPTGIQGRQALIENGPEHPLTAFVPLLPASSNTWKSDFTIAPDADGSLSANGSVTLTGTFNSSLLYTLRSTPPARRQEVLKDLLLRDINGKTATIASENPEFDSYTVSGTVNNIPRPKNVGSELYIDLNSLPDIAGLKYELKERTEPGEQTNNSIIDQSLSFMIPAGLTAVDIPEPVEIKNRYFTASVSTPLSPDGSLITRRAVIEKQRAIIPLSDLKAYNADIARLQRACSANIILK